MKNRSILLLFLLACCGAPRSREAASVSALSEAALLQRGEPPRVLGTVIDAASGAPVAGARVIGPLGASTESAEDGRFEIAGLAFGVGGVLEAQAAEGRVGRVLLRPLEGGPLEVVIFVR